MTVAGGRLAFAKSTPNILAVQFIGVSAVVCILALDESVVRSGIIALIWVRRTRHYSSSVSMASGTETRRNGSSPLCQESKCL